MEVYEIKHFGFGYDSSVHEELSAPESTQQTDRMLFSRLAGTAIMDRGWMDLGYWTIMSNGALATVPSVEFPLDSGGNVQRIYEGVLYSTSNTPTKKRIVMVGGKVYHYCAGDKFIPFTFKTFVGTAEDTQMGEAADFVPDITHYVDNIIIVGGGDYNVRMWDGFTGPSGAITWLPGAVGHYRASRCEVYRNRLFFGDVWSSTDGGTTWTRVGEELRWSNIGDPETWDDADYTNIIDKEGERIVRLKTFGEYLVIFKENSIHKALFTGGDIPFEITAVDMSSLSNAPWSVQATPKGLIFLNQEGLQSFDGEKITSVETSKKIKRILQKLNYTYIHRCFSAVHEPSQEYWLSVPLEGSSTCNFIIVWNWQYDTWRIMELDSNCLGTFTQDDSEAVENLLGANRDLYERLGSNRLDATDKHVVIGRTDGTCRMQYHYNVDLPYTGQTGYTAYFETPWLDFGKPDIYKEILQLQPKLRGQTGSEIKVYWLADEGSWSDSQMKSHTISGTDGFTERPFLDCRITGRTFKFKFERTTTPIFYTDSDMVVLGMKIFYEERDIK